MQVFLLYLNATLNSFSYLFSLYKFIAFFILLCLLSLKKEQKRLKLKLKKLFCNKLKDKHFLTRLNMLGSINFKYQFNI